MLYNCLERYVYVIRTCIAAWVVTLVCKQFCDWLMQNNNNSGIGYLLSCVMCIISIDNTGMSEIICICMLQITIFLSEHLRSYCLLQALLLSKSVSPEIQHLQPLWSMAKSTNVPKPIYFSFKIFCCLGVLSILNKLHLVNTDMLGWWLCERQLPSGGLNGKCLMLTLNIVPLHK